MSKYIFKNDRQYGFFFIVLNYLFILGQILVINTNFITTMIIIWAKCLSKFLI